MKSKGGYETTRASRAKKKTPESPKPLGLKNRGGEWHYRIKWKGHEYCGPTGLEAVAKNVGAAQAKRNIVLEQLKGGKRPVRQVEVSLPEAVVQFNRWYRSEHEDRPCKWAASLMASFEYYFTNERRRPLSTINSADLEDFKMWRRGDEIHDNTLRKQLLLLTTFFRFGRKRGWIANDPFDKGADTEVKIPSETDAEIMYILSPAEEQAYLRAAKAECQDLFDIATIMLSQGPRPDEVMSLQQSQVDLFNRYLTIWTSSAKGKTKNAHRKLTMTDETFSVLSRRLSKPGKWVFPSSKNDNHRTTIQKAHGKVCMQTGLNFRPYDFRHTFATRFAVMGGSLPLLSKLLGHADLSMLNRYVHPSQADMDRAMLFYQENISGRQNPATMIVEEVGTPTVGPLAHRKVG